MPLSSPSYTSKLLRPRVLSRTNRTVLYRQILRSVEQGFPLATILPDLASIASDDGRHPRRPQGPSLSGLVLRPDRRGPILLRGARLDPACRTCSSSIPRSAPVSLPKGSRAVFSSTRRSRGSAIRSSAFSSTLSSRSSRWWACCTTSRTRVMPTFEKFVPSTEWRGLSAVLAMLSRFVDSGALWVCCGAFIGVILFFSFLLPRWVSPRRRHFDPYFPFSIYRLLHGVGFLVSLSVLVDAGQQMSTALARMRNLSNPWVSSKISDILVRLTRGLDFDDALWDADPGFPDRNANRELRMILRVGNLEGQIGNHAREWLERGVMHFTHVGSILRALALGVNGMLLVIILLGAVGVSQQMGDTLNTMSRR